MINTKEHILNVSLKLFMQNSYKEVTLKEIVKQTGMSKGAFYHYFESKEQLFIEVINFAFSSVMEVPYSNFSKKSFYQFYHDYINYFINEEASKLTVNYISLTFDALKFVPGFQKKLLESQQGQMKAWKDIIQAAREQGEINSPMKDEEIARMFIYSIDGFGLHSVLEQADIEDIRNSLLTLWNSFYEELKV
ncbi:TetR/AcrR family transcriptional regulator [Desmospora activa]|uniref:TetR family transcriptional regulator n=1 Tax=Desmospora activa DSM 45169 TaxID=1121389 RepID=A0A2T4ZA08_9BACL|nr:TetR/AcrR family transcriptional regulator [Desmospora activa]PTM58728.1 TetR family transcriptional regulator [Desmospora activa DSM 45169]